ncbi:uncharacterized protein FTOL_00298 [Fusarium torulosum]|uniref:Uncharacterized protein n=1 Tax=Fusarium torulosum TaxID=33205 RepID=A0AAE8LY15_9HYPO|nr:uncharacterized protein FTOL_00298 [Fusarium torulosum]
MTTKINEPSIPVRSSPSGPSLHSSMSDRSEDVPHQGKQGSGEIKLSRVGIRKFMRGYEIKLIRIDTDEHVGP